MILLDTNVISEQVRTAPEPAVLNWFKSVANVPLFISAVTEAELWFGYHRLPAGRKKANLLSLLSEILAEDFANRILSFDSAAAKAYGKICSARAEIGRPISTADCQIAAIAQVHQFKIATRNTKDFESCGIALLNPWTIT